MECSSVQLHLERWYLSDEQVAKPDVARKRDASGQWPDRCHNATFGQTHFFKAHQSRLSRIFTPLCHIFTQHSYHMVWTIVHLKIVFALNLMFSIEIRIGYSGHRGLKKTETLLGGSFWLV